MRLRILLPTRVFLDTRVTKVVAEGSEGAFGILPGHADWVSAIVPGILVYVPEQAEAPSRDFVEEVFVAVDEGALVKVGRDLFVSVRDAVQGPDLGELERTVVEKYMQHDERERTAKTAMARIQAGFIRRFLEVRQNA
ncbi:MAG: F0F1 ATP synthase subunit epsilon [Desulfatibacillaceae bacterium]